MIAFLVLMTFPPESYGDCRWEAIQSGRPLVVGVRCDPPKGPWLSCRDDSKTFDGSPRVIVSRPKGGELWYAAELPRTATAAQVSAVLNPPPIIHPPVHTQPAQPYCPNGRCPNIR